MIDTTNLNEKQFADLIMEMINEINRLDNELLRVKAELKQNKSEVL